MLAIEMAAKRDALRVVDSIRTATLKAVDFLDKVLDNDEVEMSVRVNAAGKILSCGHASAAVKVEAVTADNLTADQKLLVLQRAAQLLPLLRGDVSDATLASSQGAGNGRDQGDPGDPQGQSARPEDLPGSSSGSTQDAKHLSPVSAHQSRPVARPE